jgi:hypothetical protein
MSRAGSGRADFAQQISCIALIMIFAMERFAREDVLSVLLRFDIHHARRAKCLDSTEEVILLSSNDFRDNEIESLTLELMAALPHKKVWVVPDGPLWKSEPI